MPPLPASPIKPAVPIPPQRADAGPDADAPAMLLSFGRALRMPSMSVTGTLDLLATGALGRLPDAAVRLLDSARHYGDCLTHLADDILLLGEFGSGRISLHMQSVDLTALVRTTIAAETQRARARAMQFSFTACASVARVYADPRWLASAIARPLALAARKTAQGGVVPLSLSPHGTFFRLACLDPIATAEAGDRIDADLGLNIAEAILGRHGGRLSRGPHPAYGMAVRIDLPEWQPAQATDRAGYKRASSFTRVSTFTGFCK